MQLSPSRRPTGSDPGSRTGAGVVSFPAVRL
jgi:hypothetical protein